MNNNQKHEALSRYAIDLNEQAQKGKLDPVIGRDEEIRRVLQILSRRTKNNPVLVGEAGVGKTAIVEGIAHRIIDGDVPENLRSKPTPTILFTAKLRICLISTSSLYSSRLISGRVSSSPSYSTCSCECYQQSSGGLIL